MPPTNAVPNNFSERLFHVVAYDWIGLFVWFFVIAAAVIAFFPRVQWKAAIVTFWFAMWIPIVASGAVLVFQFGFSQKDGVVQHYSEFWAKTLQKDTFLLALFAGIIRWIGEKNLDALEDRNGKLWRKFLSRLVADGWLLWLLIAIYMEWQFHAPSARILALNQQTNALLLGVIFVIVGWIWLYTTLRFRFVSQEGFAPAILRRYLLSWLGTPLQIFLMGPKRSGKSRVFSACTARRHKPGNDRPQKDTYGDRIPNDLLSRKFFSRRVVVSIIDPPGEQLGLHLHCAKVLRTDNLVLCFHIEAFDMNALCDSSFTMVPDGFLSCVKANDTKEYLTALNYAVSGDPQTFKINRITVFVDCQKNEHDRFTPNSFEVEGLKRFARSVGTKLGISAGNQFLFVGKANDESDMYFELGKDREGDQNINSTSLNLADVPPPPGDDTSKINVSEHPKIYMRTFIAAVASFDV